MAALEPNLSNSIFGSFTVEDSDIILQFESEEMQSDEELLTAVEAMESSAVAEPEPIIPETLVTTEQDAHLQRSADPTKSSKTRFAVMDDDDVDELVTGINSKGTSKMTKWGVSQFKMWLSERGLATDFENEESSPLDQKLTKFYAELRNANGECYSKSTFVGLRASINRHLRGPPYNRIINLMRDKEFTRSNKVFTGMLVKLKKEGLDKTKHHSPITDEDLNRLRESDVLNTKSPKGLQRKVWFDLSLGFGRRGQENVQNIKKNAYEIKVDSSGKKYIEITYNEATKNHKGVNERDDDTQKPRLYETNEENCPVAAFEKYINKLHPDNDRLFQQAKVNVEESDTVWYTKKPVGEKMIGKLMKEISIDANLSKVYTNHCVRATTITKLAHAGVEKAEIMKLTGHRNIKSLDSYNADSSEGQKRQYSSILQCRSGKQNIEEETQPNNDFRLALQDSQQNITPPTQNILNNLTINSNAQIQSRRPVPAYNFSNCNVNIHHYA